jgi:hypothetical protein
MCLGKVRRMDNNEKINESGPPTRIKPPIGAEEVGGADPDDATHYPESTEENAIPGNVASGDTAEARRD